MSNKELKITSSVNIEIDKGDRKYVFSIPAGAPFGESFDAAFQAMEVVSGWHEKAKEKIKDSRPNDDVIIDADDTNVDNTSANDTSADDTSVRNAKKRHRR